MKDLRLDAKLVAAANNDSGGTRAFVTSTMRKITIQHAFDSFAAKSAPALSWKRLVRMPLQQRLALGILAGAIIGMVGVSGYAYAIGSDPVSLIRRWVEGDKVQVEYQGRQFEYGKTRNYSDAAITALAEADTVWSLASRAVSNLQVPKNGIEYVDVPPSEHAPYQYPFIATVTSTSATALTLHKSYLWGDKVNPSRDLDETVTLPLQAFNYYEKGEPSAVPTIGSLVMVFPTEALRHEIGTKSSAHENVYFGFGLTHSLNSFKSVAALGHPESGKNAPLYETSWGSMSDVCLNNGADICDLTKYSQPDNQGLFTLKTGTSIVSNNYNPDALAYGEAVPMNSAQQPSGIISRNVAGTVSAITDTTLTLTTSSGAHWQLAYTKAEQDDFARRFGTALKAGDSVLGTIVESIDNLDNRAIDHTHILSLERAK